MNDAAEPAAEPSSQPAPPTRPAWRLVRSSSFRLMLLYAGLFTLSTLLLFAIVMMSNDRLMTRQIDVTVADELAEVRADAGGAEPERLRAVIDGLVRNAPGFFYLLQNQRGVVLAGNMRAIGPKPGARSLICSHTVGRETLNTSARGVGLVLPDGSYLFVGTSSAAIDDMRRSLFKAFLWSLGAIAVLGLGGGLVMSMLVLRRIERISLGIRAIMAGDLSQRIPLTGSDDEFDHLSGSLNAMLERIEALVSGMRQISNDIAHDLRTPLTRLRQRLELARRRERSVEALQGQLDAATEQVDTILSIFTSLLRIAQIEAYASEPGFANIELRPLIDNLLEAFGPVAEERSQVMSADLPGNLVVRGDKTLLGQLLANLIENALRHTPEESRIAISGRQRQEGVSLIVSDNGPGIAEDQHDFVLRRFARLNASRSTPGSGLGLSLVKAIAGLHNATFRLANNKPGLACILFFPKP